MERRTLFLKVIIKLYSLNIKVETLKESNNFRSSERQNQFIKALKNRTNIKV